MLEAIGNGFMSGLVICTFFGPIFFMLTDLGLRGNLRGVLYLSLGTFLSDVLTILIIYLIAQSLVKQTALINTLYIAGGLVLVYIGFKNFMQVKIDTAHPVVNRKHLRQLFVKGFLINSTNPNVFFFWFGAVMFAVNLYKGNTTFVFVHFFTTVLMVLTTDIAKGYGASLLRPYVNNKTMLLLGKLSGIIIVGFGVKLMFFH